MSESQPDNSVPIVIDGQEVRVPPGTNVIEAARRLGKEIPHYCYHPKLSVVGNCRMCLIETGMVQRDRATNQALLEADGRPKVQWIPRPAIACATTASPGLHVKTDSPLIRECRQGVMEFLLLNHPLDCPICDQAGECRLQEFATEYGRGYARSIEEKNVKPKRTRLGPRVMLDDERCILCSRCIRFCQEIAHDDVLGFVNRGSYTTLTCFPGRQLENNYSLNTVDICPVGALTSLDFRFKMRVWFLKETPSLDAESSAGVNILAASREGKIYRLTPRRNDAVNDTWMPDSGRILYRTVECENRLLRPAHEGRPANSETALAAMAIALTAPGVRPAIVASGRSSLEEQFLLARLAAALRQPPVFLVGRWGDDDGLLLSADRNPNVRGALLTGLIRNLPEGRLTTLAGLIESGVVNTVLSWGEDLAAAGLTEEHFKSAAILFAGTHHNATSQVARVEYPTLTVFEKSGSFINRQFRLQRFHEAVPGPAGVSSDLAALDRLLALLTGADEGRAAIDLPNVWRQMAAGIPQLAGLTWAGIADEGTLLDGSAFAHLPFPEKPALHFKPIGASAR